MKKVEGLVPVLVPAPRSATGSLQELSEQQFVDCAGGHFGNLGRLVLQKATVMAVFEYLFILVSLLVPTCSYLFLPLSIHFGKA